MDGVAQWVNTYGFHFPVHALQQALETTEITFHELWTQIKADKLKIRKVK